MSGESDSGEKGPAPPAKNPFPIAVPKGGKHPPPSRVPRWIRDHVAPTSTEPANGLSSAPKPTPSTTEKVGEPVQRATTQMLPGRLQPLDPGILQQEIRFLRTSAEEQVVTLGWNIGEPPGHVTLNHSSIQPLHAKMTYREGAWWIETLTHHDPVTVNHGVLMVAAPPRRLVDGDRIRIGEVEFRFYFP
jgi:hypothetical protein